MIIELIKGVALLLSLALLHNFALRIFRNNEQISHAASGILFGIICVVGMSSPIEVVPGVIFDARSVILSMSGLFTGWIGAIISALIAGGYRAWLGGGGTQVGVAVIISCSILGLIYRHLVMMGKLKISLINLLVFGIIVHVVEISIFTQLPEDVVTKVIDNVALPLLLTFSPAVPILGYLLRDNQNRLKTEDALTKSLIELNHKQQVIDKHAIFSETDKDGIIINANEKFCQISGYSKEEIIGSSHSLINSGAHSKDFFVDMWKTITSKNTWYGDVKNKAKDGTYYWVKSTIVPLIGVSDEIEGYLSIRSDITEERKRQQDITFARNTALEANAAKSNFIASMSHELRTPLNAIIGFSELIKEQLFGPINNKKYKEYIEDINASAHSLLLMVDDILDVSKVQSDNVDFNSEHYDVVEYAKTIAQRFEHSAIQKNIKIIVDKSKNFPSTLYADKKMQTHITNNLVSNAIKHSDVNSEIRIQYDMSNDGFVSFFVKDSGSGMSAETISKIGVPFMESDAYRAKNKIEGNGLGLYIVKNIVEKGGGQMEVESQLFVGTIVRITWALSSFEEKRHGA